MPAAPELPAGRGTHTDGLLPRRCSTARPSRTPPPGPKRHPVCKLYHPREFCGTEATTTLERTSLEEPRGTPAAGGAGLQSDWSLSPRPLPVIGPGVGVAPLLANGVEEGRAGHVLRADGEAWPKRDVPVSPRLAPDSELDSVPSSGSVGAGPGGGGPERVAQRQSQPGCCGEPELFLGRRASICASLCP